MLPAPDSQAVFASDVRVVQEVLLQEKALGIHFLKGRSKKNGYLPRPAGYTECGDFCPRARLLH